MSIKDKNLYDMDFSVLLEKMLEFVKSINQMDIDNVIIFFDDGYMWRASIYYDAEEER